MLIFKDSENLNDNIFLFQGPDGEIGPIGQTGIIGPMVWLLFSHNYLQGSDCLGNVINRAKFSKFARLISSDRQSRSCDKELISLPQFDKTK